MPHMCGHCGSHPEPERRHTESPAGRDRPDGVIVTSDRSARPDVTPPLMPAAPVAPRGPGRKLLVAAAIVAAVGVAVVPVVLAVNRSSDRAATDSATPDPGTGLLPNGHKLNPAGTQVSLGNLPMGGAVTADGKYLWTVSAGSAANDVRIVDTATSKVCQVVDLPGASGGITLDSAHRLAYVSGLPNSRWQPTKNNLPGAKGDDVLVYSWGDTCGQASLVRVIQVPPQPGAPGEQVFPPARAGEPATEASWPQKLAVSPDGSRLLVSLNLANSAAIVDLHHSDPSYLPGKGAAT